LRTYVTNDLSAETEPLKELTLGRFYPAKKWPRYSVIVELTRTATPSIPSIRSALRVGQVRLWSFFAPLLFDEPFKGMNEWKKQVAPDCKKPQD